MSAPSSERMLGEGLAARAVGQSPVDARGRERAMERVIGWSMLVGVLVAGSFVLGGGLLYLARHATETTHYRVFGAQRAEFDSFAGALGAIAHGSRRAVIQVGLLLLVVLQVVRVLLAGALFSRQRDWLYVVLTTFVLGVLVYGFVG